MRIKLYRRVCILAHRVEREEFFKIAKDIKDVLQKLFEPDRINCANLQNSSHHLHIHLIPRYKKSRSFDGVEFIDKRWGSNPSPYDKGFKISNSTTTKQITYFINLRF